LARYTACDDYGVMVNPMVVSGQVHGGIAQGIGQALLERAVYDPGSGQLVAGSFMTNAIPRAHDLPSFAWPSTRPAARPIPGGERLRRGRRGRRLPGDRECDFGCAGAARDHDVRGPATPHHIWRAMRGV